MRFTHSSSKRRSVWALIGGLFAVLMTLVFVAPADSTVIGPDNRVQTGTTSFPYNAIVEITIPGNDLNGHPIGRCTGWLYAANMVATAGHCVYDKTAVANGYFDTRGIRVWPGINGSTTNAPYKSCGVDKSWVPTGWTSGQSTTVGGDERFDYGAFRLDCPIGNTTGFLDYGSHQSVVGDFTRICGYPKDKPIDTQWCSDDQVRAVDTNQVYYANDTCERMSGSPVMWWTGYAFSVTAIHATPRHSTTAWPNHYNYNHGVRITSTVYNNLYNWAHDTSAGVLPNPPAEPAKLASTPCDPFP